MLVPEFNMYYPSEDAMDKKQFAFYKAVEASLQKGKYIDVDGNIGYVFTYLYKLLSKWNKSGYESLSEFLIYTSEIYKHEKKLSDYCLFWAYDRSEEHTSELQSRGHLVCRLLLEKKNTTQ